MTPLSDIILMAGLRWAILNCYKRLLLVRMAQGVLDGRGLSVSRSDASFISTHARKPIRDMQKHRTLTPPQTETCSFGPLCNLPDCPRCRLTDSTAGWLSQILAGAYGPCIRVTRTERSSNIVTRSESNFNLAQQTRLTIRRHVYEWEGEEKPPFRWFTPGIAAAIMDELMLQKVANTAVIREKLSSLLETALDRPACKDDLAKAADEIAAAARLNAEDSEKVRMAVGRHTRPMLGPPSTTNGGGYGKYLGFVDLRTVSMRQPIALALLVPPRAMRHDPDTYIVTGNYGRIFGATSFSCTPFSTHARKVSGAKWRRPQLSRRWQSLPIDTPR